MLGELITDDRLSRLSAGRHGGGGCRSPAEADRRSQARSPGRRYRDRLRSLGAPVRQAGLVGLACRHRPASGYYHAREARGSLGSSGLVRVGACPRQFALAPGGA